MTEFSAQLLAVFPTVLFFMSLFARSIPHYGERRRQGIREVIKNLDRSFVFNLLIDSFTLAVINGLILMFQFGVTGRGFVFMFAGLVFFVFGFSFLEGGSLMGAVLVLFMLGSLFATQMVYFWFFGQTVAIGFFTLSDWQLAMLLPAVIVLIFIVLLIASTKRTAKRKMSGAPQP